MAKNIKTGTKTVPHTKNFIHYAVYYALYYALFYAVVISGAAVFALAGCSASPKDDLLSASTTAPGTVISLDLSAVIPAPVAEGVPPEDIAYKGEYSVGAVTWEGELSSDGKFVLGTVYTAEFTLSAAEGRSFEGLKAGTWTAETQPAGSTTNFYHFGASTVEQADPSADGKTIDVSITFLPTQEQSATPAGSGDVTAIKADATMLTFTLISTNTGTWKVYDAETGGDVSATMSVLFDAPTLYLFSPSAISPRTYYVSVTEDGKAESGRLALWRAPIDGGSAMSLAARFNIPDTALPGNHGVTDVDDVSAVFNTLHGYLQDPAVRSQVTAPDYEVPRIVLGDWIDLQSLTVEEYPDIAGRINASNIDLSPHGKLLRLIVVGNNSFHSGKGEGGAYDKTECDDTPHLVFQFQNLPGMAKMQSYSEAGGYKATGMRKYLVPTGDAGSGNFLVGLVKAGVPDAVLFAPKRYVTNNGNRAWWEGDIFGEEKKEDLADGADEIQDKVWLPTAREMFGRDAYANGAYETAANQARLDYYTNDAARVKYKSDGGAYYYWEASPGWALSHGPGQTDNGSFCAVTTSGDSNYSWPTNDRGVAPAFCIK